MAILQIRGREFQRARPRKLETVMSTRKEKSMRRVFLIGALVACAVVAWAGKGGGGKPPKEDPEFTVAYTTGAIGIAKVMTATGDTSESLTGFDVGSGTNWTPDGTALLVTAEVDGRGVYTIDLATKARTKLLAVTDWRNSPDWSVSATPNGRQMIVFSDDVEAGGPSNNEALFVAETDGTDDYQLTVGETGRIWDHPRFHPNGNSIAVSTSAPDSSLRGVVLLHLGVSGGALVVTGTTNLTNIDGSPLQGLRAGYGHFQFSNDGTLGVLSTGTDIWLMDLGDPANPTNLTQGAGGDKPILPCFDAADEKIYFVSVVPHKHGPGDWRMFRMNVDGTEIGQITDRRAATAHGVSCKKA